MILFPYQSIYHLFFFVPISNQVNYAVIPTIPSKQPLPPGEWL